MDIIRHPIKPQKGKAWHWISHQYFTKQASNVVAAYIEHFSKEGDTVLDCFCGTGVTAIEALRLKRKVIAIDINPLACFITEQNCKRVDTNKLISTFERIEKKVKPIIDQYYTMSDDEIEEQKFECWYPQDVRLPKNSDFNFVEELYTKRQLLSYAVLFNHINRIRNIEIRDMMRYVFSATMSKVNLTYWDNENRGPEGGGASIFGAYRYHRPPGSVELNVWKNFSNRVKYIVNGKKKWNKMTEGILLEDNLKIIQCSVLEMDKYLEDNSIDYIYTDPPYGGNIAYLDLSTMWNAWLGFKVDLNMKQDEIIEGGDLDKDQKNYEELFAKSFEQMGRTLKKNGWLSLVFAHKKLEFWNLIIDSCEDNGMEFKGSVYQPTNNSSVHYKKNPTNVLCSQRIASFQKTHEKAHRQSPDDIREFILNEIDRACIEQRGASIDYIYQKVLDQLLDNNIIHEAKKKGYLKLDKFLDDSGLFYYDPDMNLYFVKDYEKSTNIYQTKYFQRKNELAIYVRSFLKYYKAMTFSEIFKEVFEIYADEKKFPVGGLRKDLNELLLEIAYPSGKEQKWVLKPEQRNFEYDNIIPEKLVRIKSETSTHSEIIFRLVQIGKFLGYYSWIGKREQSVDSFQGSSFQDLSLPELPFNNLQKAQKDSIQQIDIIWFDELADPKYAFEIEESTNILSGFERFSKLLEVNSKLSRKAFIVAPKSRRIKIEKAFLNSIYIGHPLYLEKKIGLIYKEELIRFYDSHIDEVFDENDLKILFVSMDYNND